MLNVEFTYSAGLSGQLKPDPRPEVVFSGRSNVGKSSLINKLCNRKALARVSSKPGKTATVNFFDGGSYNLADLPGYGYAKVSRSEKLRWAELVEGYFAAGRNIALVVQIVDMRHDPSADDMSMLGYLRDSGLPFIVVMTKSDKLNKSEYAAQLQSLKDIASEHGARGAYPFSALSGAGAADIEAAIMSAVGS